MNNRIATMAVFFIAACAETTGGSPSSASSTTADEPMLSMKRHSEESPRGNLTVDPDGLWLYTSDDACKFVQGHFDSANVSQIRNWLSDASLNTYVTQDGWNSCKDEQYKAKSTTHYMCIDASVMSAAGKSLIQLFNESADSVMWDGVKRKCMGSGPGTINVSDSTVESGKKQPPPPSDDHAAAGSNG